MMKGMLKRALGVVAAAAMAVTGMTALAGTANAAVLDNTDCGQDGISCTVTLNASNEAQFTGHTFKAVQIAEYDVYGTSPNQSLTLATNSDYFNEIKTAVEHATGETVPDGADPLAWAQQQGGLLDQSNTAPYYGDGTTRKFADELRDTIGSSASDVSPTGSGTSRTVTFSSPGLYLILDQAASASSSEASSRAVPMLVGTPLTLNGSGTPVATGQVDMKNQITTITKQVTDPTVETGKDAEYTLTTYIPNYVGYKVKGYIFTIADHFDADDPISYKGGTLKVTVGNDELGSTDYTTDFADGGKSFSINLSSYIQKNAFSKSTFGENDTFDKTDLVGKQVTVTYKATVNDSLTGKPAVNTPVLTYSNDPTNNATGDVPGPREKVFNFDYTLKKIDRVTGASLEGATFVLYRTDGTDNSSESNPLRRVTTDSNGEATFEGLDEDVEYTIKETGVPTGYMNLGLTFHLTIDATIEGEHENAQVTDVNYTVSDDSWDLVSDDGKSVVTVENVKNVTQLPATGAAGIAMFAVVAVLVAGAGLVLYGRSRKAAAALRA